MMLPVIYFCAVINNGTIYWRDDRLYTTEKGVKKRLEFLKSYHKKGLVVLYADDFKQA